MGSYPPCTIRRFDDLRFYLMEANALIYISDRLLSTKANAAHLIDFDEIQASVGKVLPPDQAPAFSPLLITTKPESVCAMFSGQNHDDQMGVAVTATLKDSALTVLTIYDCSASINGWQLHVARRARVCTPATGQAADPVTMRQAERSINDYFAAHTSAAINPELPVPARANMSFVVVGEAVTDSFVSLYKVSSSVLGYIPSAIAPMVLSSYRLPSDKDVAILLSQQACEAMIACITAEYQNDPKNAGFMNEAHFAKHLDPNVKLCIAADCSPDPNSLQFNVSFSAKYEATAPLGKDWNCDIYGFAP